MDKAKAAAKEFLHKANHNNTTVHERVAPAVTHEVVQEERKVEVQPVVDREIHQDHYHISEQPVYDREVLPTTHTHQAAPVEERVHHHNKEQEIAARLKQEAARYTDKHVDGGARETRINAAPLVGEHVHHHVHETIQPVVHKETIQPHIVHTTVPVHEVVEKAPTVHTTTTLPAMPLSEFQAKGGVLSGREERYDSFEGEPRPIGSALGATGVGATTGAMNGTFSHGTTNSSTTHHSSLTGHDTTHHTKPKLLDRLNPLKDSDHDGKKGFME